MRRYVAPFPFTPDLFPLILTGHLHLHFGASVRRDKAIFQDEIGRAWLVEIQYGHPAPAELGIFAARFVCPEAPAEGVRVGFVKLEWVENSDEVELRMALAESDPARPIG